MTTARLKDCQMEMARYLRDPLGQPPPGGVEKRRLKIYEDLVYNNIEGFISSGFPVLRSLYPEEHWHSLVRLFIDQHRCHSPYFLEISQEFLGFLMNVHQQRDCDPAFLVELAHYEWVELALDVSEETLPAAPDDGELLHGALALSPLAWLLQYRFPVHRIGPSFQPEQPEQPTYLVVYRNRDDQVQFMELNAATARLLELVRDNDGAVVSALLSQLARELDMAESAVLEFGGQQLQELAEVTVVIREPFSESPAAVDTGLA